MRRFTLLIRNQFRHCSNVHLPHSVCHMVLARYRHGWMQIWKKVTIRRSVNTNIERNMKALESRFVWMLKSPSVPFCFVSSGAESSNNTRVQVSVHMKLQTLHLCMFERSRITQHYTCAGSSAREPRNHTPVQFRALTEHHTLRLCTFERS